MYVGVCLCVYVCVYVCVCVCVYACVCKMIDPSWWFEWNSPQGIIILGSSISKLNK